MRAEKTNYYPEGILKLYRITRTPPNPPKSDFCYQAVRIRNPEELTQVKISLDWLASILEWQDLPPLLEDLKKQMEKQKELIPPEILALVQQYPESAISMLKAFNKTFQGKPRIEDFPTIKKFIEVSFKSLKTQQKNMLESKIELLKHLNKETSPRGISRLNNLLDEYDLPQLTSVMSIITNRLQKLRLLEATIQNENAYEIKGKASVHNQLLGAMWIINDSYWLLHSNEPLANFLRIEYGKKSKRTKRRPDFICVSNEHSFVIIEIKRPSHEIEIKDINQIQEYLATIEEHRPEFVKKKGYLIGKTISGHLQKIVDNIENVEVKPYTKLIDDCRRRYQAYLEAIDND